MKLGRPAIKRLSEMICGNETFPNFPYRKSSELTKFFFDLDMDYAHDGSSRASWVESVLIELNEKSDEETNSPSHELCKLIEYLLHPDHFLDKNENDHSDAIAVVNKTLKSVGLKVDVEWDGQCKLLHYNGEFISSSIKDLSTVKHITFSPSVFNTPNKPINKKLVSVMMPFNKAFDGTYLAIKRVTDLIKLECYRADDIWENSTFIQDIFELIFCAEIVIVDFTGRNPNVMYETGIAHTLGKEVIPIAQTLNDIPSDLAHHRALIYLANDEGYRTLSNELYKRINSIIDSKNKLN
jgi:hypothetical protein